MHIVVSRTHIRRIRIGQPPFLRCLIDRIGRHHIETACLQGRYTLREDEWLTREVLWHILHPLMMIVKTNQIDGSTLEEVVIGRRLVTAGRDGARSVVTLHDLRQMLGEQTLYAQFPILRQRRCVVTCVQDQVRLFQRQGIGLSRGPLLEHLVTYRPHQYRRVITIAQHQIRQVALMPLVEETGIVVLCLLASPHIEALVHHDQSHRVAHIQQFRGWRIMRRADRVHTHRLQLRQLTMQRILIERSAQTSEVVMLTDTIQLEVLAIEPETSLGIELEIAEARSGLHLVHHLATGNQLCTHRIDIRILAAPFAGLPVVGGPAIGIQPGIPDRHLLTGGILVIHLDLAVVYIDAPVLHVDGRGLRQPHMTVDAAAAIPAGIGLVGVVDTHGHHVLALLHIGRDVILETRIAVRTEADLLAVHIDRRVHIDAVELQEIFLVDGRRQREMLPVPPDSPGQGTTASTTGVTYIEVPFDGPVMGHIETAPIAVVIIHLRHLSRVA